MGQFPYEVPNVSWVQYVVGEIGDLRGIHPQYSCSVKQVNLVKGRNWDWKKVKCSKCGVFGHNARSTRFHPSEKMLEVWRKKSVRMGWVREEQD